MNIEPQYQFDFSTSNGTFISHDVYEFGSGKTILLLQELPGIEKNTLALVEAMKKRGFKVILPHFLGRFGKKQSVANLFRIFCIRNEMNAFASNLESPLLEWLNALCNHIKEKDKTVGIGVLGMCLTGNFAISLISNNNVKASISSQPSLPLFRQKEIGFTKEKVNEIKRAIDNKGPIMAYRFCNDILCKKTKFISLDEQFNEQIINEINTNLSKRLILKELESKEKIHSVFTTELFENDNDLSKIAFEEMVTYFENRL